MVASARASSGRWARGIKKPNEVKLDALRLVLERNPDLSKADMCRRVGVSRATLAYYLRVIRDDVQAAATKMQAVTDTRVVTHLDLVKRLSQAAEQVWRDIEHVRATSGTIPSAVFNGYRALVQVERLLAELLGQLHPPTQNVYLQKIDVLLNSPASIETFPATLQAALTDAGHD